MAIKRVCGTIFAHRIAIVVGCCGVYNMSLFILVSMSVCSVTRVIRTTFVDAVLLGCIC